MEDVTGGCFLPGREAKKKGFPPLERAAHGLEGPQGKRFGGLESCLDPEKGGRCGVGSQWLW